VSFVYARGNRQPPPSAYRGRAGRYPGQKVLIVLRRGSTATISVPRPERARVALLYASDQEAAPRYALADGEVSVTLTACGDSDTQFNGGMIVAGPRCVELDVRAAPRTRRVWIPFGTGHRPCPGARSKS
jgi:hypothetical protein